jgi:hypothetical protein
MPMKETDRLGEPGLELVAEMEADSRRERKDRLPFPLPLPFALLRG